MFFITEQECRARAVELSVPLYDSTGDCASGKGQVVRFNVEGCETASIGLARTFISWLGEFGDCLLWVCEFGIWPSRADLNLYYRLRASYGDRRRLYEAPGHLFLSHERSDLASHLSLAIQFGWGAHVLAGPSWTYMFLSHDGWALAMSDQFHKRIIADLDELAVAYEVDEPQ